MRQFTSALERKELEILRKPQKPFGFVSHSLQFQASILLGFLLAVFSASSVHAQESMAPEITSPLEQQSASNRHLNYQISATGSPDRFEVAGLPDTLAFNSQTGLISGFITKAGAYPIEISAINAVGRGSETLTLTIFVAPPGGDLRILRMDTTGSKVVELGNLIGDDRGGIAVGFDQVLVTGDESTSSHNLSDLANGRSLDAVYDGLFSDFASGKIFVLAFNNSPYESGGPLVNQLMEISPISGQATGLVVDLSTPISVSPNSGVFSGNGRVVIHNGTAVFDIRISTGRVTARGSMPRPDWFLTENWASWGVAEFFGDQLFLTYRGTGNDSNSILRTPVPNGATEKISSFNDLGDIGSWTVSPLNNRWYFQHESGTQFGGSNETLGYADALIDLGEPTVAPTIVGPSSLRSFQSTLRYQIQALGFPTEYGATGLPEGVTLDSATGLISGFPTTPGEYIIEISATNGIGTSTTPLALTIFAAPSNQDLRIRELRATGSKVIDHNALTGDDRAGIAVGIGRVLVTGDSATASYDFQDLGGGVSLGTRYDSLCSDLSSGTIFTLALNGVPHVNGNTSINQLLEIDATSGQITQLAVSLSEPVPLATNSGVFSGSGRIVIHNGSEVFDINVATGIVIPRGAMPRPNWASTEGWASWGVAEFFGNQLFLAYRGTGNSFNSIVRSRVPDGFTETISTFDNLGDLGSWTVSPLTNRWYFHHEGGNQFGGSRETLGYADAIIEIGEPTEAPQIFVPETFGVLSGNPVEIQVRAGGSPTSFRALGLPDGVTIDSATGLITGTSTDAGDYVVEVSATNVIGTTSTSVVLRIFEIPTYQDLRIRELLATGSQVIDNNSLSGDDRGGIAVGLERVFITGDSATASYDLFDLGNGVSAGTLYESIFSDLSTGAIFTLASNGEPMVSGSTSVNQLLEIDGSTGQLTGVMVPLTEPIQVGNGSGVFSGAGRVIIYNGTEAIDVHLATGVVVSRGVMERPPWFGTESWAAWGVAEFFEDEIYLAYRGTGTDLNSILRTRVPDGPTETIASFDNLGDLGSWSVSPLTNRWYFQHEGSSQFGGSSETLGYADAVIELGEPIAAPQIFIQDTFRILSDRLVEIQIRAGGSPTSFGATGLPAGVTLDPASGLISGTPTTAGEYLIEISATNALGTSSTSTSITVLGSVPLGDFRILELGSTGSRVIDHNSLTGDDRAGIAVSFDRVFVTGDSATASYDLGSLGGGTRLNRIADGLCSDLANGLLYTLAFDGIPHNNSSSTINQLIELDPITGDPTGAPPIELTQAIPVSNGAGVFSGGGRVAIHNGTEVFDIITSTGGVTALGPMPRPGWYGTEGWAIWGVAEFFGGELYLAYRGTGTNINSILRTRVTDSFTETIETFTNLGDLGSWTVSPLTNRWYFHSEGSNQFGGSSETLGYADAIIEAGPPTAPPQFIGSLSLSSLSNQTIDYRIRTTGKATNFTSTTLPSGLSLDQNTGALSGTVSAIGIYPIEISATNIIGTSTETIILSVVEIPEPEDLRIRLLEEPESQLVEVSSIIGDDRGGIAVSTDRVLVTGDAGTGSFDIETLADGVATGKTADGLFSDLNSGRIFDFSINGVPIAHNGTISINELVELDPLTGERTGLVIRLSETINIQGAGGVFSGAGRVVIHTGIDVYDVNLSTGNVTSLGAMTRPAWSVAESWATWGVAEFFEGQLHLAYKGTGSESNSILRSRVPDGHTEKIATFTNLGDLSSWTVSPATNRWYFQYEGSNQFGGSIQTLGYANAFIDLGEPTEAPVFIGPAEAEILRTNFLYQIQAGGSPTNYGATGLPLGVVLDPATGLITGDDPAPGEYLIEVSATNAFGTSSTTLTWTIFELPAARGLRILELRSSGAQIIDHDFLTGDDRGGIAVSADRVLVTGDSATASYDLLHLGNGASLGVRYDSLCSDLSTGALFTLGLDGVPHVAGTPSINQLLEIDNTTGSLSGLVIPFAETVPINDNSGIFSGMGRIVIHNGVEVFDVHIATGTLTSLGAMNRPPWYRSESWAIWGVAEFFENEIHLVYRGVGVDAHSIFRTRVPDGLTETIATFQNLGDLNSFTVSPLTNRWYFHHEGGSQFGGSSENLGFADAVIDVGAPTEAPQIFVPANFQTLTGRAVEIQILAGGSPTSFGATGLPDGLVLDSATGLISGTTTTLGESLIEVSATNVIGTSTASFNIIVLASPVNQDLRIRELKATGSQVIDHNSLTGDDRAGIAVGFDRVLVTGDSATASYDLEHLGGGISSGTRYDSLCSDLATGALFTLALDGVPHVSNGPRINQLLEINSTTGRLTGVVIPFTESISLGNNGGVFSGAGRVVIYNGAEVFDIQTSNGLVISQGTMPRPAWYGTEGWASWGVAEFFDGELYLTYRGGPENNSFARSRVPDGLTETIATFENLSDLGSWTVSPLTNRWYFHHEGASQFGGSSETLGFADAIIELGAPTTPPQIFVQEEFRLLSGRAIEVQVRAGGDPTSFGATGLPDGVSIDPATGLISGTSTTPGDYLVEVSATNALGTSTSTIILTVFILPPVGDLHIRELRATGSQVIDHNSLTGDDRGGIAVGFDRVLVTGDSSTASYDLEDLGSGTSLGRRYDSLCSDLSTGTIFTLAFNGTPHESNGPTVNQLLEIDGTSGQLSGLMIALDEPISLGNGCGVFSGAGRVVIHNGTDVFDILVATGTVRLLGPMARPSWNGSESWASWGVAEFFEDELYLTYRGSGTFSNSFLRSRVPDGLTETVATFENLSDLASWTVSPLTSRWYFHHEGGSQFGGSSETLGYADAVVDFSLPNEAPVVIANREIDTLAGQEFSYQIRAVGNPTSYGATGLPEGLSVNPATGHISGIIANPGVYPISISATNPHGTRSKQLEIIAPNLNGKMVAIYADESYVDLDQEIANLQTALNLLDFEVTLFTGTTTEDWNTAFAADVVIVPELETDGFVLPSETLAAINAQLDTGKGLIVMGSANESEELFLNSLRGWTLLGSVIENDGTLTKSNQVDGFDQSPVDLATFSGTYLLNSNSLPNGAVPVYSLPNTTGVFYDGNVGYLGYDWFSGAETSWDLVLHDMVRGILAQSLQRFSIATTSTSIASEGDEGTTEVSFIITRDGNASGVSTIDWSIDLSADNLTVEDFQTTSGSVEFAVGVSEQTIVIPVSGDFIVERDESFMVTLSNPQGTLTLLDFAATNSQGTILNDDQATLTLTGNAISEGDQGSPVLTFTATLDNPVDTSIGALFSTLTGGATTATGEIDYTSITDEPLSIPALQTEATISVTILPDNAKESDETINAILTNLSTNERNVSLANLGESMPNATILDDDFAPIGNDDGGYQVIEDGSLVIDTATGVLSNDTDQDDGPVNLTATLINDVSNGLLVLTEDGSFNYTPNANYFGPDSFTYRASDGTNQSAETTVTIETVERIDLSLGIDLLQTPLVAGGEALETFRVSVTNNGPSLATGVTLSLTALFPAGVETTLATPDRGTLAGGVWNIGALNEGISATLNLTLQADETATNGTGIVPLTVEVTSAEQLDTDPTNDTASAATSIISAADTGVESTDGPTLELQSGLLTSKVVVTNRNSETIPAFRLYVKNLPDDVQVYNAHGVRSLGDPAEELPYFLHNQPLAAAASVTLTVEFFRPSLDADFTPVYEIELLPFSESVPGNDPTEPSIAVERMEKLANNDFLIEIASVPTTVYAIEYSSNMIDWQRSPALVTAVANRLQWIDNGPPKTSSHPSQAATRYYRFVVTTP